MAEPYVQHARRWLRTLSRLTWRQVLGWLRLRLRRPRARRIDPAPSLSRISGHWRAMPRDRSLLGPSTALLHGRRCDISAPDIWDSDVLSLSRLFALNAFPDLAMDRESAEEVWHRDLLERWIDESEAGAGAAWHPRPSSLRVSAWAKWLLMGHTPVDGMTESLATQADWLSRRLELHRLGHRLIANAKALTFAGTVLEGPHADRWHKLGLSLLETELPAQILEDGGHIERSVMIHAQVVEDILDLIQLAQLYPKAVPPGTIAQWRSLAGAALGWLARMSHPDGKIAFFNDATFGGSPDWQTLSAQAEYLGVQVSFSAPVMAQASGYARLERGPAVLICDTAPLGARHLAAHGHADTLSFELSLGEHRVIVNGGTSTFERSPERIAERSTASHNTIQVDQRNSSELWGSFRVARRARVYDIRSGEADGVLWHEATHDGYLRVNGPVHARRWELGRGYLSITDWLEGRWREATARFRLAPGSEFDGEEISGPFGRIQVEAHGGALSAQNGRWASGFGRRELCTVLHLELEASEATVTFRWE